MIKENERSLLTKIKDWFLWIRTLFCINIWCPHNLRYSPRHTSSLGTEFDEEEHYSCNWCHSMWDVWEISNGGERPLIGG